MSAPFVPSGVVTLLTDFGTQDTYVGQMKGVLLARAPGLRAVVDLTHAIPAQDVGLAAFHLRHAYRWFPPGTLHVAVVDPGVGSTRDILLASANGHGFLAPDNGLLGPLLGDDADASVWALDLERIDPAGPSRTFHGRDRFVPAAAAWLEGGDPDGLGRPRRMDELVRGGLDLAPPAPRPDGSLEVRVLFADRFGNVVTNLPAAAVEARTFTVETPEGEVRGVGSYADVERGETLALVNSFDLVEIAVRDGDARARLGLGPGDGLVVRFLGR